jgi:molybdate transport system ATP-binding protein
LMDEPLSALDEKAKRQILPYLESLYLEFGIPMIYVSHSIAEVAGLCENLVLMEKGKVTRVGKTSDLLSSLDYGMARDFKATNVIRAEVLEHDEKYHLSYLGFGKERVAVQRLSKKVGDSVNFRFEAKNVSLSLAKTENSSILNCLKVRVLEISDEGPGQTLVRLDASGNSIVSRITRKSCDDLKLRIGLEVYAQIKSVVVWG